MKFTSPLSWFDARRIAQATGQSTGDVQRDAAADAASDQLQPKTSAALDQEFADLEKKRAELEARQAAQRAIVVEWDGLAERLDRYRLNFASAQEQVARMHEHVQATPARLAAYFTGAFIDISQLAAATEKAALQKAALPYAEAILQASHETLGQHIAEMRTFGAANKVPKEHLPAPLPALPDHARFRRARQEEDARINAQTEKAVADERAWMAEQARKLEGIHTFSGG